LGVAVILTVHVVSVGGGSAAIYGKFNFDSSWEAGELTLKEI
jgi:hypothetical protein